MEIKDNKSMTQGHPEITEKHRYIHFYQTVARAYTANPGIPSSVKNYISHQKEYPLVDRYRLGTPVVVIIIKKGTV